MCLCVSVCAAAGQTWKAVLEEMSDPGPFTITATLEGHDDHVVTITDVLFGDVWLCAGENNMMYSVDQVGGPGHREGS